MVFKRDIALVGFHYQDKSCSNVRMTINITQLFWTICPGSDFQRFEKGQAQTPHKYPSARHPSHVTQTHSDKSKQQLQKPVWI